MSIALATGDTITGVAGSATSITFTITGDEIAAGADAFKVLAQGQLPSSIGTLYTVPASTEAIVKGIHLVNVTAGTVTASLAIKGTAAANQILPPISILAGGFAVLGDDGWHVYNDQGQALGVGATGATGAAGADGADGTNTVIVQDEGTPLATAADTLDFVGAGVTASGVGATKTITIPGGLADQGVITFLDGTVAAAPATPGAGKLRIYAKTGPALAVKDDAGNETVLGAGGGGSVATDTIWDAAGDLAVGTGANTAGKLAMGSALQHLRVNAGGTALEYAAPSGGLTHAYLGYDTVGASWETMTTDRVYAKKITVATAGIITSIGAYVQNNAAAADDQVESLAAAVYTDAAGTPGLVVAYSVNPLTSIMLDALAGAGGDGVGRWLHIPIGLYVAAGDYWIAVAGMDTITSMQIAYDGSGSDRYYTAAGTWFVDWGWYAPTTGSNKYSIRASIIS